jgi:signal transduction histidine kinase
VATKTAFGLDMDGMALLTTVLFASYTAGRQLRLRPAVVTIAVMVALVWSVLWRVPDTGVYDWVFASIWIGGPGVAGAVFRHQLQRAEALGARLAWAEAEREEHARAAVLEERVRIARELHDTVAHAVSVMVLHAGAVRSRLPAGTESEQAALSDAEGTGRRAIAELRRLLSVLRSADGPAATSPQPTLAELDGLVEESRKLGLAVALNVEGDRPTLEPAIEVSAYRIVQEALTNVRKHGRARSARVDLGFGPDWLRVRVADDGVGAASRAAVGASGNGHGLVGIRERVDVYGGRMSVSSPPGGGFVLEVALPLASA